MPEPQRPDVEARLLRTEDLIDLTLAAYGCHLEPGDPTGVLVADDDALLVVGIPPQHVGEEVWQLIPPGSKVEAPPPHGPSRHRSAEPSRLVFAVPPGTRIDWHVDGVLAAISDLDLVVPRGASPAGEVTGSGPEPPQELETAIEAPYRLVVSPSRGSRFRHAVAPRGPEGRSELWRTELVAGPDGTPPVVRARWTRDDDPGAQDPGFEQSLTPFDRRAIVTQTQSDDRFADTPLQVTRLALSTLGAWLTWAGFWDGAVNVMSYRHEAEMGRDSYVRVAYPGFLFPFGHRCLLVKITERKVRHRDEPVAYLWQRWFIIIREPTRSYPEDHRDLPFAEVTVGPPVTPNINTPDDPSYPFIVERLGEPYPFTLTSTDRSGATQSWAAPLVFVQVIAEPGTDLIFPLHPELASGTYAPVREILGRGQSVALARPVKRGDTSVEVATMTFDGDIDGPTSRPKMTEVRGVLPPMRQLSPSAPTVTMRYSPHFLADGLPDRAPGQPPVAGRNAGEVLLDLVSGAAMDFGSGSERSGGFVSPSLDVKGLSRSLGTVGADADGLANGAFNPTQFFGPTLLPRLFGLFNLTDILAVTGLGEVPAFVSDAAGALTTLTSGLTALTEELDDAGARIDGDVADAAHAGAGAVATAARDALAAQAAPVTAAVAALRTSLEGLPGTAAAVPDDAAALIAALDGVAGSLGLPGIPAAVRARLTGALEALRPPLATAADVAALMRDAAAGRVTARLKWNPEILPWGIGGIERIFDPVDRRGLRIDVVVQAFTDAAPKVDVTAEIANFNLNLIGAGDSGLMQLKFRRIGFHAGSAGKPEVDVVFGGIAFLGPLAFVDTLRSLIPFDGFSDPPFVDVKPEGVTAGFDLALPNVGVGVFSLENITLGADARVPFLGDALTVGFHFCSKDAPFRLTVMCVGGGGWLVLRAAPKGLVLLELGLEAAASLSVDLGVASGSVSIAVGAYLRLEGDAGKFTAYFRIRGEVDVLGLISASITLELSLTYDFATDKLHGRASLMVEVEVFFFSASVEIVVERQLAGSRGDPTMRDTLPPDAAGDNADWATYCNAFASL
ncbi:hypothetical protein BW730_10010 [Tessaracoccus aquimaris]|uniref:Uncharacterized protein n=1 Tax=Tessaracoccus aquimaris TaxID=1332264 RepID=A0A1Q2CNX9_9ACTN|nr:hypothetical protein [Tessaracoccus aquimaris]AQP47775.1 hypothetical protein BW730_10010 [Tessaracoccus aquimaris]